MTFMMVNVVLLLPIVVIIGLVSTIYYYCDENYIVKKRRTIKLWIEDEENKRMKEQNPERDWDCENFIGVESGPARNYI